MKTASCYSIDAICKSTIALGLILATSLGAQSSSIVPKATAKIDASNSTAWPFGLGLPSRMQGLYHPSLFATKPPAIKSIAFRAQGKQSLLAKKGVELEIRLSTSPRGPWNLDKSFSKNVGLDERIVFKKRRIDLPASASRLSPQAFLVRFPLDSAFAYQQSKGSLLVEIRVHAIPTGAYELDASYTECARHVTIGKPCGSFSQLPGGGVAVSKGSTTQCGSQTTDPFLSYTLRGGHPGGVALHLLSSQKLVAQATLPLGGCALWIAPEFSLPLTLDKAGEARINYPLQLLHGKKSFYSQFLSVDLGLTSIRSTQALQTRLGGWDAIARIVAIGKSDATSGFVQPGASWVLEFGH